MSNKESTKVKRGNKELANLVKKAAGNDRSLRKYALDAGVNPSTVTRIVAEEYMPGIKVLQRLASKGAAPRGGVRLSDFLDAAGYSDSISKATRAVVSASSDYAALLALSAAALPLSLGTTAVGSVVRGAMMTFGLIAKESKSTNYKKMLEGVHAEERKKQFELFKKQASGIMYTYLGDRGFAFRLSDGKELEKEAVRPDYSVKILDHKKYDEWWFICWPMDFLTNGNISKEQEAELMVMQLLRTVPNEKRMVSIIVEDDEGYSALIKLKNRISYKGNLSAIKVDVKGMEVEREETISNY